MTDGRHGIPASWVAIAALFALVALPRPAIPLIDGDVYWHIRAGLEVLGSGRVPSEDAWSIVGDGMPWISQDWLSNVLLAFGWRLGELGPTVLSLIWALFVVVALSLLWQAFGMRRPESGWLGRIVWLAAGLIVAGPVLGVRVQVVDLTLAAAVVACLWAYLARPDWRWLIALPIVTVAWANLHAGWPLIWLLGGAVVVGEAGEHALRRSNVPPLLTRRQIGILAAVLVLSIPLLALNPNGLELYTYPLETSSIAAHRDFISEWQAPDPGTFTGQVFICFTILVTLPALWLGRRSMRLADALWMIGLTLMIVIGARFLLLAPIIAVTAGLYLEPAVAGLRIVRHFRAPLERLGRPRHGPFSAVNAVLICLVVVAGLGVTWFRVSPSAQAELVEQHMPVYAVDWVLANDPGSRPLNYYAWGGYLGLRRPEHPVYIDGRSDIYGDAPIREYAEAVMLESDPGDLLDRRQIDYVLFPVSQALAGWLDDSPDWRRAYADDLAGVWIRE